MNYKVYGRTGLTVSRLGFGTRLPLTTAGAIDFEEATPLIRAARDLGITIFDTMEDYYAGQSEMAFGRAMEGMRERFIIQTKLGSWPHQATSEMYRERLEQQLARLRTGYVDIELMHNLHWEFFTKHGDSFLKMAARARDEGLIRHIGFSSHDRPDNVLRIIDTGVFECMLVQYNMLDAKWGDCIRHAHEKGLGVSVMGPVGGGRLAEPGAEIQALLTSPTAASHRLALRYVLSNPCVDVVLSGMECARYLADNAGIASDGQPLTADEREGVAAALREKTALADLYCTGCLYCMPCPHGVDIPRVFECMIAHKVYGATGWARGTYATVAGRASLCRECGACEGKCPQHIPIMSRLKEVVEVLERPRGAGAAKSPRARLLSAAGKVLVRSSGDAASLNALAGDRPVLVVHNGPEWRLFNALDAIRNEGRGTAVDIIVPGGTEGRVAERYPGFRVHAAPAPASRWAYGATMWKLRGAGYGAVVLTELDPSLVAGSQLIFRGHKLYFLKPGAWKKFRFRRPREYLTAGASVAGTLLWPVWCLVGGAAVYLAVLCSLPFMVLGAVLRGAARKLHRRPTPRE